ncbi:MAG: hypothetical protein IIZ78_15210 [Clostridiales bacterium]|nr:hypothetical protein [Clostridiales bacterium]
MKIKGEIGETVYIPVTIREIRIDTFGTRYVCELPKDGISQTYEESEVRFLEENLHEVEEKVQKHEEKSKKVEKTSDQKPKVKRGRPRKATVDDLLNTAKSKSKADIPNSAIDALSEELRERGIM